MVLIEDVSADQGLAHATWRDTHLREPRHDPMGSDDDDEDEDDDYDDDYDDGQDDEPFSIPPGWLTVPGPTGRTFTWTDGQRTVGSITQAWEIYNGKCLGSGSGTGAGTGAGRGAGAGSGTSEGAGLGTGAVAKEDDDFLDDDFLSVAALLDSLELREDGGTEAESGVQPDCIQPDVRYDNILGGDEWTELATLLDSLLPEEAALLGITEELGGATTAAQLPSATPRSVTSFGHKEVCSPATVCSGDCTGCAVGRAVGVGMGAGKMRGWGGGWGHDSSEALSSDGLPSFDGKLRQSSGHPSRGTRPQLQEDLNELD